MTPEEKAKELVEKFMPFVMDNHIKKYAIHNAKQCALICCDEILGLNYPHIDIQEYYEHIKHLKEVKKQIENI